jgi:MerR family transcriptional regulator/heat shock protein HspR
MANRAKTKSYVMISAVSERFEIHPQTLRLYEREGLIKPPRSSGNTRLYDEETIRRLEIILSLTREMGVNLAGVEVVLNMREQMKQMRLELDDVFDQVRAELKERKATAERAHALVKVERGALVKR